METVEWYIEQMLEGFGVAMKDLSWRRDKIVSDLRHLDPSLDKIMELENDIDGFQSDAEMSEGKIDDLEMEVDRLTDKTGELESALENLENVIRKLEQEKEECP